MNRRDLVHQVTPPVVLTGVRRLRARRAAPAASAEKGAAFYDNLDRAPAFTVAPRDSPYYFLWTVILDRLRGTGGRILEIGCGTGQLAQLLREHDIVDYVGFDFSDARVAWAKEHWPDIQFECADAYTTDLLESRYDTVICTEVLEHVQDDLGVLGRIRPGTRVIASVPDYPSDGHVRHFRDVAEVVERYGSVVDDIAVTGFDKPRRGTIFLIDGTASSHG